MKQGELRLLQRDPHVEGGVIYKPFPQSDSFDNAWWDDFLTGHDPERHFYFSVLDGDTEVARAEVEVKDDVGAAYGVGHGEGPYAVIGLIEVAADRQREGVGGRAVDLLAERFPVDRLAAFSEADEFWASLGWTRYEHSEGEFHQLLFIR